MKKLLIAILAVFATASFAQEAFPDIPAGHWAGDAVSRIADLGIVIGFPDGTYRGNESFTRYQMALVISRLLDVIQSNMDAMKAMTDADIASLRNALQELASDVAAQGVRLNAAEGAIGSISDDVMSNTARIAALEDMIANMDMNPGIDPAIIAGLQNQIDSARIAADTAAAQAAAAAAAAGAAADAAAAAGAQARQNAASIDAINDLLALLNSDIDGLRSDVTGIRGDIAAMQDAMANMNFEIDPAVLAQIDRNTSDIANIREFVILLRRDQVALRDRVAALEAADAAQADAIADLQARLDKVENDLLVISGSITVTYKAYRTSGPLFDIDRVWGINSARQIAGSNFSSGTKDINDDGDSTDVGEKAQDRVDIEPAEGEADVSLTLNVGFSATKGAKGSPRALNSFDSVIKASLKKATVHEKSNSSDTDTFTGYVFSFDSVMSTFDPIGAAPLTFAFGKAPKASFTSYVVNTASDGFVATVGSPDFLAFLAPTLKVIYGEIDGGPKDSNANDGIHRYFRGVRGTLSPLQGDALSLTGGFSFAQESTSGPNLFDTADDANYSIWGVDGQVGISIIKLNFEFANESAYAAPSPQVIAADRSLFFVEADVDVASLGIPVIKTFNANFRSMPAAWYGLGAGFGGKFNADQTGFGVKASLGLFILDPVTFYFDSFSDTANVARQVFGIDATINLFRAFAITGFFHSANEGGAAVAKLSGDQKAPTLLHKDNAFGVNLKHDGKSADALIPGLNLSAGYKQSGASFEVTTISVDADTDFNFGFLSFSPYAGFESVSGGTSDKTTIKAGTGLKTDTFDFFLKPSLEAAVNFRTTDYTDAGFTASELQWGVGVNFAEFLFPYSDLRVKYGSWSGSNVNAGISDDAATDISGDDAAGTGDQSTSGYEIVWNYYDLIFAYATYTNSNAGVESAAQAFKITYTVTF